MPEADLKARSTPVSRSRIEVIDRPSAHGEGGADLAPTSEPEPTDVGGDATASAATQAIEHHHHDSPGPRKIWPRLLSGSPVTPNSGAAAARTLFMPDQKPHMHLEQTLVQSDQKPHMHLCIWSRLWFSRTRNRTSTYAFGAHSGSVGPETAHAPTHLEQILVRPDQKPHMDLCIWSRFWFGRTRNRTCTYAFGADSGSAGPESGSTTMPCGPAAAAIGAREAA